jgi:hypothetical protein
MSTAEPADQAITGVDAPRPDARPPFWGTTHRPAPIGACPLRGAKVTCSYVRRRRHVLTTIGRQERAPAIPQPGVQNWMIGVKTHASRLALLNRAESIRSRFPPYGGSHYVIGSGSWPCAGSRRRAGRLGCWATPLPGLRQLLTRQAPAAEVPVRTRGPCPARHASVNDLVPRLRIRTGRSRRRRGSARCT